MSGKKFSNFVACISKTIVDRRNLFFLIFIIASIFCMFSMNWTKVENDITTYLSEDTATRKGLDVMNREFVTFGTAQVMVNNITFEDAEKLSEEIKEIEGVSSLTFENNKDHYLDASALFVITFDGEETDEISLSAMEEIKKLTKPYDVSIKTTVGSSMVETLAEEMNIILIIALVIIVVVLLFTSKSYAEIIILMITFGVAALLNMGTNYLFGKVSFISNSVAVILQLALAIDYAIILCHRFLEERTHFEAREACITALSKAIPEVCSSSLTTISGLLALSFMNFKIGADLSIVLIKAILCSIVCVFCLMPGLLVVASKWIDKTKHKNFVPSIKKIASKSLKLKNVVIPVFAICAIFSFWFSNQTQYLFGVSEARAARSSQSQIDSDRIKEKFGSQNLLAVVIPSGDYQKEAKLIKDLEKYNEVEKIMGIANTDALDGYTLTDQLTAREFSELMDLDYEVARMLYATYAINDENYGKLINNMENYSLPLLDLILFLDEMVEDEYVTLDADLKEELESNSEKIKNGQKQLESEKYSRMLMFLNLPEEGEQTFNFLDEIEKKVNTYYDEVYLVGNPTSNLDLSSTFSRDNIIISVLSALFVMVVLLFTFRSVGAPVLLIIIIQSAIFMNFAFPYIQNKGLFFIGYLVVSSIQMGANVDYAIVITNRYMQLKQVMNRKKAIIQALDESFVTIITSGTILATAGIVIQYVTTDGTIAVIGECIGRGTIISMILVLFVLPSILYIGTNIIEKTSFSVKLQRRRKKINGKIKTNGYVKGYVSGYIDAKVYGTIVGEGEIEVSFDSEENIEDEDLENDNLEDNEEEE